MKQYTLILIDWDDTLFPTSWVMKNKLDLSDPQVREKYKPLFSELDNVLNKFLTKITNIGKVIIVTNASESWINTSKKLLPYSSKIINKKIKVVSARDKYGHKKNVFSWKELSFEDEVHGFFYHNKEVHNIVSIGDAEYEQTALVKLDDWEKIVPEKRILKTIKLMDSPSYHNIVDQLNVLIECITNIVKKKRHMHLIFKNKK